MTRNKFLEILDLDRISYFLENEKIVIDQKESVWLHHAYSLPPKVEFRNVRHVFLNRVQHIPSGVEFNNEGKVGLDSLIGGYIDEWAGNIPDIESKKLLNLMIKKNILL
jgi:hypothetical protein